MASIIGVDKLGVHLKPPKFIRYYSNRNPTDLMSSKIMLPAIVALCDARWAFLRYVFAHLGEALRLVVKYTPPGWLT